jgi:septum site-determining protein MinC
MYPSQNERLSMGLTKKSKQEAAENISIKGTKEGLVVTIGEGEWSELMNELTGHLQRKAAFFSGAHATLDLGSRDFSSEHLKQIRELFSANEMKISGIRTSVPKTAEAAGRLEIPIRTESDHISRSTSELEETDRALFLRRTIRSGQKVQYPGHITIIGDVNPGAEVVAGGDVMIWGKLRGTVHAGAKGGDSAIVCALLLAPTQLRIGNHIARSPEGEERDLVIPEIARVDEKGIVVEPWNATK